MLKELNVDFERALRLLVEHAPISDLNSRKALIPHDIRVGVYLYENKYSRDIIIGGILHDALEFTDIDPKQIEAEFGNYVIKLVRANSKDDSIKDKEEKTRELISRCVDCGEDALIIKTADIIDSFKYYTEIQNVAEIEYCHRNAKTILSLKPEEFSDKIFVELAKWN